MAGRADIKTTRYYVAAMLIVCTTTMGAQDATADDVNASALQSLQKAKSCKGQINHFGRLGKEYIPPSGTIGMSNDGGWCWVQIVFTPTGPDSRYVPGLKVTKGPSSGEIIVGSVDLRVRLAYKPKANFTGTDSFNVTASSVYNTYDIPVAITVMP